MFDIKNLKFFQNTLQKMDWISQRQKVIAENIANANTPRYKSKDIEAFTVQSKASQALRNKGLVRTHKAHMNPIVSSENLFHISKIRSTLESSLDENNVILEDEMEKIGGLNSRYSTAANLFQKNVSMIRMAIKGSR